MINALTQSPFVGNKIYEWKEKIENQQILIREIIDIDSTYEDFETSDEEDDLKIKKISKFNKNKDNKIKDGDQELEKKQDSSNSDEDEFNVSLAKMEEEIKPKILNILNSLNKNYSKLKKYQLEKLDCLLDSKELSVSKIKILRRYKKY